MNQQSFATYIGIAPATVSSIMLGRTKPSMMVVEAICAKMPDVNLTWLFNGQGSMLKPGEAADGYDMPYDQQQPLPPDAASQVSSEAFPASGSSSSSPSLLPQGARDGAGTPSIGSFDFSYDNSPVASTPTPRDASASIPASKASGLGGASAPSVAASGKGQQSPASSLNGSRSGSGAPARGYAQYAHRPLPPSSSAGRSMPMQGVQQQMCNMKNVDRLPRRITEIRVFYDDQTWESFVPKK